VSRAARGSVLVVLALLAASLGGCGDEPVRAAPPAPRPGGDPERGAALIRDYGCGACHVIPGVRDASGLIGPPLNTWSRRAYIAGEVPNAPDNLVRWLVNPPAIEPGTAMPVLGLAADQARDVAAYLYTLR
jgi:cytochrome c2